MITVVAELNTTNHFSGPCIGEVLSRNLVTNVYNYYILVYIKYNLCIEKANIDIDNIEYNII